MMVPFCVACAFQSPAVVAHGSVTPEDDLCIIKINFYKAHFTVFQPHLTAHEEFCEDLPAAGETLFVLNYMHDSMREVPLDFRIVVDRHRVGRFARFEDVEALDLDRDTVFYQPPIQQSDGTLAVLHEFERNGDYIGVVTAHSPTGDKVYRAVFPFSVGTFFTLNWELVLLCVVAAIIVAIWAWLATRRRQQVAV